MRIDRGQPRIDVRLLDALEEHRKGQLPTHELPGSEARAGAVELERVERTGREG